jgi:hypothetical protein
MSGEIKMYDAFLNPSGSDLPRQYRFGMAGKNQDEVIERFLREHRSGVALNLGCGVNYEQQSNIAGLVRVLIAGDISESIIKTLNEEHYRKSAKYLNDFCFHDPPQRNMNLRVLDASDLDVDSESIDVILLLGFFGVLRNREHGSSVYSSGHSFASQVIGECHRVNGTSGNLLVCNNIKEPREEYLQIVQDAGYSVIESYFGDDIQSRTDSSGRYLLVCEKL